MSNMFSPKKKLNPPETFVFPFTPYTIQDELMRALYNVLENREIGIFESPTGTGKSLTLTCSSLTWFLDHKALVNSELCEEIDALTKEISSSEKRTAKSTDWINEQFANIQEKKKLADLKRIQCQLQDHERRITDLKELNSLESAPKIPNKVALEEDLEDYDDILDDFEETSKYLEEVENEEDKCKMTKVFFASRTHSQLSQVINEIKKSPFGKDIRCTTLASRQNLCINPNVLKLKNLSEINEKCLDMQKSKSSKTTSTDDQGRSKKKQKLDSCGKCEFKNQSRMERLKSKIVSEIMDIEDLVNAGKKLCACPYYTSRSSVNEADIVLLPYQILFHKKTRAQTGINLENSIVIIDEAHNLLDAIFGMYGAEINLEELELTQKQIQAYKKKYISRFSSENLLKINQLLFVIKRLIKLLDANSDPSKYRVLEVHELFSEGDFFNINLFHLIQFCEHTLFEQKIRGFSKSFSFEESKKPVKTAMSKVLDKMKCKEDESKVEAKEEVNHKTDCFLRKIINFLESITETNIGGKVLLKSTSMKFLLVNTGEHFQDIVDKARAIVIAGGTMRPTDDLINQIFSKSKDRVKEYIYDHVVPKTSILPMVLCNGPTSKLLQFQYNQRCDPVLLNELGMTLFNICNIVPAGIICFFNSYDYLFHVHNFLIKEKFIEKIEKKKFIFCEQKGGSGSSVDSLLENYSKSIRNSERNGALLLSVVGGKLSEGLNFSDDLGRCVVVVGMPYPNKESPELKEKMKKQRDPQDYYENLCMKAVNQCIGRSVRHIKDYAAVILLDERYKNPRIQAKLPKWISRSLLIADSFKAVPSNIIRFFNEKKSK